MRKDWVLTQEAFDAFLRWLSLDRDEAAVKYEKTHHKLIRFFDIKGCENPDLLADETINRVIERISRAKDTDDVLPMQFLFGVAKNIYREHCSNPKNISIEERELEQPEQNNFSVLQIEDDEKNCMQTCLKELKPANLQLIVAYFNVDKNTKAAVREKLCQNHGESMNALRVRVSRIKQKLQNCQKNCLTKEK